MKGLAGNCICVNYSVHNFWAYSVYWNDVIIALAKQGGCDFLPLATPPPPPPPPICNPDKSDHVTFKSVKIEVLIIYIFPLQAWTPGCCPVPLC